MSFRFLTKQNLFQALGRISQLVFPNLCPTCESEEPLPDYPLCLFCKANLCPIKNSNDARSALIGKDCFPKEALLSHALWYFSQESISQKLIHQIKYNSRSDCAFSFGKDLGRKMMNNCWTDYILIPVPLHRARLKMRGYNQSKIIASGISEITGLPICEDVILRTQNHPSLTKTNKEVRKEILNGAFEVREKQNLRNSNILLVDDVITTGATINACVVQLKKYYKGKISVVSLAIAI